MTQILPFADPAVLAAYNAFERAIYDEFAGVKAASWEAFCGGDQARRRRHRPRAKAGSSNGAPSIVR
jgi:hypothetical protein